MVAVVVSRRIVFRRGPHGIAEDLNDRLWVAVGPGGAGAEPGAAAIDAKSGGAAKGKGSDGEETGDGNGGIHVSNRFWGGFGDNRKIR